MKKRIGIDIDEILRAKWLQFDRFYAQKFGEEGIPENPYTYSNEYFRYYKFDDVVEEIKVLKDPEDTSKNINPLDYQEDSSGEAPADVFLFKRPEKIKLTAREAYNRFMYEDYLFELHASPTIMYRGMDLHISEFLDKYGSTADFTVMSIENRFSIPPTLFFLSKMISRFNNYRFVDKNIKMWEDIDVLITTDPELLKLGTPWGKNLIKINRPYNQKINAGCLEVLQIRDLMDNEKFEKIIKYKNKIK